MELIGWVIFRYDNISVADNFIQTMFGIGANAVIDNQFILYLKEILLVQVIFYLKLSLLN
jgi:hypothetical protein